MDHQYMSYQLHWPIQKFIFQVKPSSTILLKVEGETRIKGTMSYESRVNLRKPRNQENAKMPENQGCRGEGWEWSALPQKLFETVENLPG